MTEPVMQPKVRLVEPKVPEELSVYEEFAKLLPAWSVRTALLSKHPRHLYNYMRFDSGSSDCLRNLGTMLVDSNFYLTDPAQFNDPFEFKNQLVIGSDDELRSFFGPVVDDTYPKQRLTPGEREAHIAEMIRAVKADPHGIFGALFETHIHGVHCFTPDGKHPLMWSHYADSHKGICLQFRTSFDVRTFLAALPVDYCDEFPKYRIPEAPQEDAIAMTMRKGTAWSYEGERRIVLSAIASRLLPFAPRALTGIILGTRFSPQHLPAIEELLRERESRGLPSVQIYEAKAEKTAYRLNVRKYHQPA